MNTAIIVAAGSGKRFGGEIPKQFLQINEKPILIHTLERFEKCDLIDEIVLVLSAEEIENFTKLAKHYSLSKLMETVVGGETRAESVRNGLNTIDSNKGHIIAVHDGARPLVTPFEISKTIKKADKYGAACLVADVTDTIKEVSDNKIVNTVNRSKLRRALTPQCFRYEILQSAFNENEVTDTATDECFLVEKAGFTVATVKGSSKNIKITRQEDFEIAKVLLELERKS